VLRFEPTEYFQIKDAVMKETYKKGLVKKGKMTELITLGEFPCEEISHCLCVQVFLVELYRKILSSLFKFRVVS